MSRVSHMVGRKLLLIAFEEVTRTERNGGISASAALSALFGEALLVRPFALEAL